MSNLGSSIGTALVGSVLAAQVLPGNKDFAASMVMLVVFSVIGLVLGFLIPGRVRRARSAELPRQGTLLRGG